MIPQYDILHSLRRETDEREAAKHAASPAASAIHEELADRYADRAWGAREARCTAGENAC